MCNYKMHVVRVVYDSFFFAITKNSFVSIPIVGVCFITKEMAGKFVDESKVILRLPDLTLEPQRMLPPIEEFENRPLVSLKKSIEQMVWTVKQNCQKSEDGLIIRRIRINCAAYIRMRAT